MASLLKQIVGLDDEHKAYATKLLAAFDAPLAEPVAHPDGATPLLGPTQRAGARCVALLNHRNERTRHRPRAHDFAEYVAYPHQKHLLKIGSQ